jgi:hypothetical protein
MREDTGSVDTRNVDTQDIDPAESAPARRSGRARERAAATVEAVRLRLAALTWLLALGAAIVLSLGAMLVALGANTDNPLVGAVLDLARALDGPFWRVFDFYQERASGRQGPPDPVKNHLVNWGLAAATYLVVGRLASNLIRPSHPRSRA